MRLGIGVASPCYGAKVDDLLQSQSVEIIWIVEKPGAGQVFCVLQVKIPRIDQVGQRDGNVLPCDLCMCPGPIRVPTAWMIARTAII